MKNCTLVIYFCLTTIVLQFYRLSLSLVFDVKEHKTLKLLYRKTVFHILKDPFLYSRKPVQHSVSVGFQIKRRIKSRDKFGMRLSHWWERPGPYTENTQFYFTLHNRIQYYFTPPYTILHDFMLDFTTLYYTTLRDTNCTKLYHSSLHNASVYDTKLQSTLLFYPEIQYIPPVHCTSQPDNTVLVFINIHATAVKRSALNPGTRFINSLLIIKTTESNIRSKDAVPH